MNNNLLIEPIAELALEIRFNLINPFYCLVTPSVTN